MSYCPIVDLPQCIHLAGADGSGKTTQARAIQYLLRRGDISAQYVWLRFPHLFCIPFLIYARLRGYSYQETVDGHQHGYWHFGASWIMSRIFPWALLLDTWLAALVKVYLPLWRGDTVVCDRFVVDVLVDLMTGLDDVFFDESVPGQLFLALLPRDTRVVILDLDTAIAQQRCVELVGDRSHARRRALYLDLAHRHHLPVISTEKSIDTTTAQLLEIVVGATS